MDSLLNTYLTLLKMSENDPRYESMLFNYETTMRNDFRHGALSNVERTVYIEKPKCLKIRPPPLKDIHTLTDWKTPNLPIDLMIKPKEIVRTDPRTLQQPYTKIEDIDKEKVRATRPRLAMVPAINIDDIDDKRKQEILIRDMYTSTTKAAMISGTTSVHERPKVVQSPLRRRLAPAKAITLKKFQYPYISPEWRMDSASWDTRQLRGHCDPDRDFYLSLTHRSGTKN